MIKVLTSFFLCLLCPLIAFPYEKYIERCVQEYLDLNNTQETFELFEHFMYGKGESKYERIPFSSDNQTEILFRILDRLADKPDKTSPQYNLKVNQILTLIRDYAEIGKFRHKEISNTNLDDNHIKILFKALKRKICPTSKEEKLLAEFIEKMTELDYGYSKESFVNPDDEHKRLSIIESWQKAYFEKEKEYPPVVAQAKSVVAWELFKQFIPNAILSYDGSVILDGGTIPFSLKSGLTQYTIYLKQTSIGNWKSSPRISIESESSHYYRSTNIDIYDNTKNPITPDLTIDNFINLFKDKKLYTTIFHYNGKIFDANDRLNEYKKMNSVQSNILKKFLNILNITDKKVIKILDNSLEDKKLHSDKK